MENKESISHAGSGKGEHWYDKSYKFLLIIPIAMLAFSIIYLVIFHQSHGDFINKDVTLTGGTIVTVFDGSIKSDIMQEKR